MQKSAHFRWDCCYLHPNVYRLAKLSAGCAVQLTDAVLSGKIKNGFGILRPPGHHAMFDEICGYCYFNNVAICARHALAKGWFNFGRSTCSRGILGRMEMSLRSGLLS